MDHQAPDLLPDFDIWAARSRSVTRISTSSSSTAFIVWFMMHSAARTRVDAGVFWSSMILSKVVAAAVEPCCKRAMDCENAARRASRYAVWNSGSFNHRRRVVGSMPMDFAASSILRWVSSAAIASSCLRLYFAPWPFIWTFLHAPDRRAEEYFGTRSQSACLCFEPE